MDYRVISIGALDAHPLWNERSPQRSGHATCTLVRGESEGEKRVILVDPSLPAPILKARLLERSGLTPDDITHVFLTSFLPEVRRGIELFEGATWWISGVERESVGVPLISELQRAAADGENELAASLERDVAILKRCEAAPDTLADHVDLFPLPGVTPGLTGLLLEEPRHTTLICGDAVPTSEHLERGAVPHWAGQVSRAKDSFAEAVEIADVLILGRDNVVLNPTKRPF
ncbi:MAG: hypothetical protein J0L61_11525 [Planctomycetes bacterium]|nr:hypothetical protein [Planctomycetota bacterium]